MKKNGPNSALIVIDLQNDFCPGGALAVAGGNEIVPLVNGLIEAFDHVILTQDWHPAGHSSFASSHAGQSPFSSITMPYGAQTLWPDHCVQGTAGAEFHRDLHWTKAELIIRKGFRKSIDSYSAFYENDRKTPDGFVGLSEGARPHESGHGGLGDRLLRRLLRAGRRAAGFNTTVLLDGCRAIDLQGSLAEAQKQMRAAGVVLGNATEFAA